MAVFLSYAKEDGSVVTRVYEDLLHSRSNLRVWYYEKTSQFGVDFRKEYASRIEQADYLILFDSAYARRSVYVKDEIALCQQTKRCRLLPCLLHEQGTWRDVELFARQNYVTYIDFTDYESGIRQLCSHLEVSYIPRFTEPRDLDFMAELKLEYEALGHRTYQEMTDEFELFRRTVGRRPNVAAARLITLIDRYLAGNDLRILSPFLALGVLETTAGHLAEAASVFREVSRRAPEDPRGWAGQAESLFRMRQYAEAAECLEECLKCLDRSAQASHEEHRGEVIYKLASAYLANASPHKALMTLQRMPEADQETAETLGLIGQVKVQLGDLETGASFLHQAVKQVVGGTLIEAGGIIRPDRSVPPSGRPCSRAGIDRCRATGVSVRGATFAKRWRLLHRHR